MALDAPQICSIPLPYSPGHALASLANPAAAWFRRAFSTPTPAQCFAWPVLQRGEHLLLSAPTGTGKTLAAFLPIISRLADEPTNGLACLYVAPMKALARDVAKNLRICLRQLRDEFRTLAGGGPKRLRVGLRTGDTSATARRRQLERPPHILLTTPESLAVLLTNPTFGEAVRSLRWIVVDEIHAMAGNKRGADLALSLERLADQAPTPQRIGLSATCVPLHEAAQFLVGVDRPCTIAQVPENTSFELTIEPLTAGSGPNPAADFSVRQPFDSMPGMNMARLVARLESELATNRTTLIFTNARGTAERLTWALKRRYPQKQKVIAVHHSSLAAPRRRAVERGLKKGRLEIVVTSTSLELGIDIGTVDGVVLVHPPGSVARLVQRLGRAGHRPGQQRRGLLLTSGPAELLEATVCAAAGRASQLEACSPALAPLDVLCQHLVGLAMTGAWTADDAYRLVGRAHPYRALSRADFDACLAYLSGTRADGHAWLPARLRWQGDHFTILNARTEKLLRRNFGTILSEEPRPVRRLLPQEATTEPGSAATIGVGSLDEAYADRLRPGDRLLLDGRCFEYRRRENGALLVEEASTRPIVPRWQSPGWSMSRALAQRVFLFRQRAAEFLRDGARALQDWLGKEYLLGAAACSALASLLLHQETVSEIPDADVLLVEAITEGTCVSYYLHTPLHRPGNDALARLLTWRIFRAYGLLGQSQAADLGFALTLPTCQQIDAETWRSLFTDQDIGQDLAEALADSASLRERFAQVATIGLMVLRNPLGPRRKVGGHDWAQRRLFDQLRDTAPDFVLLRQAEREMATDICDTEAARAYVKEFPQRHVRCRRLSQVSPLATAWTQPGERAGAGTTDALADLHAELVSSF